MSLRSELKPITSQCAQCCRSRSSIIRPIRPSRNRQYATSTPSGPRIHQRGWPLPLGLSLLLLPPLYYYLKATTPPLNPQTYTDHSVSSNTRITPQHTLTTIPLSQESLAPFTNPEGGKAGVITVHHVMVKNPHLMIERPYTPINDVGEDGEVKLIVKRVKGGEVGRMVHSLKEDDSIGLRGPIPTFSLNPRDYSRIVMISTGTAIAPFLQLLSKMPAPPASLDTHLWPQLHLIHSLPTDGREDWAVRPDLLPALQQKFGKSLDIQRVEPGPVSTAAVKNALSGRNESTLVLVCLPPAMLNPLCGPMTPTMGQGEVTGILRECGLTSKNVFKLG